MFRIICLLIGYAIGCFQTAYIVGKLVGNIDIRDHGSKSAGMTNITRVLGAKSGLVVFATDIIKAILGYYICTLIFDGSGTFRTGGELGYLPGIYGGIGVILGHNFPIFLKLKGGKGIASSIGLILSLNIWIALIVYCVGFIALLITKYVSVASLLILGLLPILMIVFKFSYEQIILGFLIMGMAYYQHRANIKRLMDGNENKFSVKKK